MIPFLKSLLIPGWSQLDFDKKSAFLMFSSEVVLVLSYVLKTKELNISESNYKVWAYNYSNSNNYSNSRIYTLLEDFYSKEFFLIWLYDEARRRYPDNLDAQAKFIEENNIDATWKWKDIESYFHYQSLRSRYRSIKSFRDILGFTILANHIVSAVHSFLFYPRKEIEMGFYPKMDGAEFFIKFSF
ncbi:MAG: hypothetical protein N2504_02355 [candidate division WOR-3 bacterium]|nr:hypothetical protein [candidate division WOR-3 bacterium]MCX7947416.1 hypothetical protein [candidate division WOR-3 bacterium]MDW8151186.1 hypothetical protein [candidate division WOR-3 bacterium]